MLPGALDMKEDQHMLESLRSSIPIARLVPSKTAAH